MEKEPEKWTPSVPPKWYFYSSKYSIDDPTIAFAAESFKYGAPVPEGTPETPPPLFSQGTMRRSIYPVADWLPFSPCDNLRLSCAVETDPPVAVGHDQLLFEVDKLSKLKPIYWPLPQYAPVIGTHWVFQETLTPVEPSWDEAIMPIYERFVKNYSRVVECYERATVLASEIQECVHFLDLRQDQKYLRVAVLFSALKHEVYIFKASSSYIQTRTTATHLLKGKTPRDVLAVLSVFDFSKYKQRHSLPNRESDDPLYAPLPINNLVLVLHGVGQKLSDSYSRVNFVYAIDRLRVQVTSLTNSHEVERHFPEGESENARFLVLPVNWRSAFKLNERPFDTDSILVRSLTNLRHSFVDALMDIPLYMSENRRPGMLAAAASEANRLFDLVCQHHPGFASTGRVHLVGHSLGSLITADLLSQQPTHVNTELDTAAEVDITEAPFKFNVHNFFNTGSMLGMFMVLKEKKMIPRAEWDEHHSDCFSSEQCKRERPFGCFAAKNIYNIIHPCDLLSFLMDATVEGADSPEAKHIVGPNGENFEPCELPYLSSVTAKAAPSNPPPAAATAVNAASAATTAVATTAVAASAAVSSTSPSQSAQPAQPAQPAPAAPSAPSAFSKLLAMVGSKSSTDETNEVVQEIKEELIADFKPPPHRRRYSRVQAELFESLPPKVREVRERFQMLNENGQIDWRIPDHTRYTASHYLKILTAHFDYWSNLEVAKFIAVECIRHPGATHTIPDYRCQWSLADTYPKDPEEELEVAPVD